MESSFNANFSLCFCFLDFCVVAKKLDRCKKPVNFGTCQTPEASDIRVGFIYSWVIMPINDSKWGLLLKMTTI